MEHYQTSRVWVGAMQGWAHFNNAHSHYVQLAAEGGLLVSLPAMAAVLLLARTGLKVIHAEKAEIFWIRIGAAAGLIGIAVQGIWEVPLVMPANAVLCGVLAGMLLHRRDVKRTSAESPTTPDNLFE
jgi:ammonia channel protein AmtB